MAQPQPILTPLTPAAIFLVVTIGEGGEQTVHDVLADLSGLERSVGFRVPGRPDRAWPGSVPTRGTGCSAAPARPNCIRSSSSPDRRHRAPATPGDLLFHIRAERMDVCFEFAARS